jgi:uncharacterized membrane protein YGL010W
MKKMPAHPPPASAPFSEKLAFYKSQHTGKGVRTSHLVGIPTILLSLPLLVAKPRVGASMFVGGWAVQLVGHRFFEHNMPSLRAGPITYQLAGVSHWCEEIGEMLARRAARRAGG